jgi:hypothetical protein
MFEIIKVGVVISAFELFHCYSECDFWCLTKGISCVFGYHTEIAFSTKSTLPWLDKRTTMWRHVSLFCKRIRF